MKLVYYKEYLDRTVNTDGLVDTDGLIVYGLSPSDAYMYQQMGSSLVQVKACCLFSTKPLTKQIL